MLSELAVVAVDWAQRANNNIFLNYGKVCKLERVLEFTAFCQNALHLTRMQCEKKANARRFQRIASEPPNFSMKRAVSFCFHILHHAWLSHSFLSFLCVKVLWILTDHELYIYFFLADNSEIWTLWFVFHRWSSFRSVVSPTGRLAKGRLAHHPFPCV